MLTWSSDPKRAYLRRKHTSTKKAHFTEGWVEFKDKKVARAVAEMLNAQPIGGKKGTRWRDDVWTMKYLPRFKWNMLTEQVGKCTFFSRDLASLMCLEQLTRRPYTLHVYVSNSPNRVPNNKTTSGKSNLHAYWINEQSGSAKSVMAAKPHQHCNGNWSVREPRQWGIMCQISVYLSMYFNPLPINSRKMARAHI